MQEGYGAQPSEVLLIWAHLSNKLLFPTNI